MNYYYDVLLNFQEEYYMFYEWDEKDNIEFIKKIPLIHVSPKVIIDALENIIEIDKDLLNELSNKTKLKQNKTLEYACIISDGKNSLALEFNQNGLLINKSSLILEDELNINEFIYSINKIKIDYKIVNKLPVAKEIRQDIEIKRVLKLEIDNIYQNKNYSKLKYLYLEWFNELLGDIDLMYKNMLLKIDGKLTMNEYHIYELIKLSYNNV